MGVGVHNRLLDPSAQNALFRTNSADFYAHQAVVSYEIIGGAGSIIMNGNIVLDNSPLSFVTTSGSNGASITINGNIIAGDFLFRNSARDPRQIQWGARYVF